MLEKFVPILGVCVGMQIMAVSSDEGELQGLGWLDGNVKHLSNLKSNDILPHPHMGWNKVEFTKDNQLWANITSPEFYFLHSYYLDCYHENTSIGLCEYGKNFTCAIQKENIFATQFHPEKSHEAGMKVLKNFHELI